MSADSPQRIALLGATGSIGSRCLDVVRMHRESMSISLLTAHARWRELAAACEEFRPRDVVLTGVDPAELPADAFPRETRVRFGMDELSECVAAGEIDVVVSAIVGAAGLLGTWSAVRAGKRVALANKETMVVAGPIVTQEAERSGAKILPVDSEHSAIFQALQCGAADEVRKLILTASGGPFRTWPLDKLEQVTVADALRHPTWEMGRKITVDSATMMNKALEIIEARWLFGLPAEKIDVVVHPQSVVHSLVEFVDGSVLAQLSPPDMALPIQYALTWPHRRECLSPKLDWTQQFRLEFEPPDAARFPALRMGFEVARRGGTAGTVLNAANEVAVERFLRHELKFLEIPRLCRSILDAHDFDQQPTLERVLELDRRARTEACQWNSR